MTVKKNRSLLMFIYHIFVSHLMHVLWNAAEIPVVMKLPFFGETDSM